MDAYVRNKKYIWEFELRIKLSSIFVDFNFRNFTELLDSYLSSTHLHGCRYIVDKQYNFLAPVFWIILISLSFTFCVHLIFLQLNRFQDTPVLNVITSTGYPVWKSPFPAVVVCNHNVIYRNNTGNVTRILQADFKLSFVCEFRIIEFQKRKWSRRRRRGRVFECFAEFGTV